VPSPCKPGKRNLALTAEKKANDHICHNLRERGNFAQGFRYGALQERGNTCTSKEAHLESRRTGRLEGKTKSVCAKHPPGAKDSRPETEKTFRSEEKRSDTADERKLGATTPRGRDGRSQNAERENLDKKKDNVHEGDSKEEEFRTLLKQRNNKESIKVKATYSFVVTRRRTLFFGGSEKKGRQNEKKEVEKLSRDSRRRLRY